VKVHGVKVPATAEAGTGSSRVAAGIGSATAAPESGWVAVGCCWRVVLGGAGTLAMERGTDTAASGSADEEDCILDGLAETRTLVGTDGSAALEGAGVELGSDPSSPLGPPPSPQR
jgi:hypothetical protein